MALKILVVEDEPSISDNISYALSTEGYEPVCYGTGKEALGCLKEDDIALIILDIGLPDVNGFELLKDIRSAYDTPIICVTARSSEVDKVVGLEVGADDYVVKPFSPRELTARVRAILRRTSDAERSQRKSGAPPEAFSVDEERYTISYYGEPLDLSRYEYRLLRVLIGSPGQVFTREQLMDRVWEEPDMSLDRTVDTHIKTIRQKLKAVRSDEDPIVTHRGIGYSVRDSV